MNENAMEMKWDEGFVTITDEMELYVDNEATTAWSKLASADNIGDMIIKGRSLDSTVIMVDELDSRISSLEYATANIDMEQINGLEEALYTINISTEDLERSFRNLQDSFNKLQNNINSCVTSNRLDIKTLEERERFLDSRMGYLDCRINSCLKEVNKLKEKGNKKVGARCFLEIPDYFEKMNFKNRAIKLDRMALNTIMEGTM